MVEKITHNFRYKIIALLIAVLLWFVVVYAENPEVSTWVRGIPISYSGIESLSNQSLLLTESEKNISIKITGNRRNVSDINPSNVTAQASLKNITKPGEYDIPVSIDFPIDNIRVSNKSSYTVHVKVDEVSAESKAVKVNILGEPAAGYALGEPQLESEYVHLSGLASEFSNIASAEITVDVAGASSDVTVDAKITLIDNSGNPYSQPTVKLASETISVVVPILPVKKVEIHPAFENANDVSIIGSSVSPESVLIKGKKEDIENITHLSTKLITLTPEVTAYTSEVYLPNGVYIADDTSVISVNVTLEGD